MEIEIDSSNIDKSNFWDSCTEAEEAFFLNIEDKNVNLLMFSSNTQVIKEIEAATAVIVTQGKLEGKDTYEVLFEDNSDTPFVVMIDLETQSNKEKKAQIKDAITLTVWDNKREYTKMPMRFRKRDELPSLEK